MITIRLKVIRFAQFGSKNNNYTNSLESIYSLKSNERSKNPNIKLIFASFLVILLLFWEIVFFLAFLHK